MVEPFKYLDHLMERFPVLLPQKEAIKELYEAIRDCYEQGGKLLIAGNGGSSADSEHMVGELMKGFVKRRPISEELRRQLILADPVKGEELADKLQGSLPAIALSGHPALSTAYLNDVDGDFIYAQQLHGYGNKGDVLLGISTSGNAKNIRYAATVAKAKGMKVVGLTGRDGGSLAMISDVAVIVPEMETYKIQELHLPVYHALCLMLEAYFFKN